MKAGFGLGTFTEFGFFFGIEASFPIDSDLVTLDRVRYRFAGDDLISSIVSEFNLFIRFSFSWSETCPLVPIRSICTLQS